MKQLWIRDILVRIRISGSVPVQLIFCLLPFEDTFISFFIIKKSQNSRNPKFILRFLLDDGRIRIQLPTFADSDPQRENESTPKKFCLELLLSLYLKCFFVFQEKLSQRRTFRSSTTTTCFRTLSIRHNFSCCGARDQKMELFVLGGRGVVTLI
jgi:hypothetical protein